MYVDTYDIIMEINNPYIERQQHYLAHFAMFVLLAIEITPTFISKFYYSVNYSSFSLIGLKSTSSNADRWQL